METPFERGGRRGDGAGGEAVGGDVGREGCSEFKIRMRVTRIGLMW